MRRAIVFSGIVVCLALQTGCSALNMGKQAASQSVKALRPNPGGYADDNNSDYVDTWSEAGQIGRGDRALDKTYDGFKWGSDKARAIDRSLGFDAG